MTPNEYLRGYRAKRIANKQCIDCGEPVEFLSHYCTHHRGQRIKDSGARKYAARRRQGPVRPPLYLLKAIKIT